MPSDEHLTAREHADTGTEPLRVLFALAGLHRVTRGAEVAFEAIARHLGARDDIQPTLIGSGGRRGEQPYAFQHVGSIRRERFERWPRIPVLRNEFAYEELTFALGMLRAYRPADYDLSVTCGYPFTNWFLRSRGRRRRRPAHVFVTQNGDWPASSDRSEFRYFDCDGLVCTNIDYHEQHRGRWLSALIPNGVDPDVFRPGAGDRAAHGLPDGAPVILMVSALSPSKHVLEGIRCAARLPDVRLVVAGDGPLREQVQSLGRELLGERFRGLVVPRDAMPDLYRCADVLLHMSRDEPSANAYIEALATGLPIVTHDRKVTRWTFEDLGVLVDTTDESAVVEGLEQALSIEREDFTAACRSLVNRRYDWRQIADEYQRFFRTVVARRRAH